MTAPHVLALTTILQLVGWLTVGAILASVVLVASLVVQHARWTRDERRRARIRVELEPIVSGLLGREDPVRAVAELRPVVAGLGPAERPVAASLLIDLAENASPAQREGLRRMLEGAGAVALAERGTRRRSPWRRALACETLGKIGAIGAVPALVERLDDRRPEVRIAAVRALGQIGSAEAAGALTDAFLERRGAPPTVMADALRRLGDAGRVAFARGSRSTDSLVRIASCFGLAATASHDPHEARRELVAVLGGDAEPGVRTAAAAALGIVGGPSVPFDLVTATRDGDVRVRRAAVKALGSFDDPAAVDPLVAMADDEDRETALRAAEALLALSDRQLAGVEARDRLARSASWSVEYARAVAEVVA